MSRPPRLALLPPRVWHSTWGQEKNLTAHLAGRYSIDVLDLVDFGRRHAKAGPNRFPLPAGVRLIPRATPPGLLLQGLYLELANCWRLLFGGYDLLVTYLTTGGLLAALAARLKGTRILLIYADDYVAFYRAKSRLAGWLTARLANPAVARSAQAVVATAELLAEDLRPYHPGVIRIPNGTDVRRLGKVPARTGGRFTVGFVGGFGHWVDFEAVVQAVRLLPETRFVLVGGGDRFEEVQGWARDLANLELTGQVGYDRVLKELGRMDLCLIPFKVSGLTDRVSPIKLFEYWAAGRPVAATPIREVRLAAGEEAAAFYQAGEGADLARVITELKENRGQRQRMVAAGRKRLAEHDWSRIGDRYLDLLGGLEAEPAG